MKKKLKREHFSERIDMQYKVHSICGILGPRQAGKTTLAHQFAQDIPDAHFFDLENPFDLSRLENPMLTLSNIESPLIVIDEIQRIPDLFPVLRVLVDEKPRKFLILGSASRDLLQQSSESLAGRIGYIELTPFSISEVKNNKKLWLRGGFPVSFLANSDQESYAWRQAYISNLIERDIPNLGFNVPPIQIRKLWMMLAHNHGGLLNLSDLGKSLGITQHTVQKYANILAGTFMIRLLEPWFENIKKRQIKSPKIYIRDSGLLHALLGIKNDKELYTNIKLGASWEGFALEEIIKKWQANENECFFWRTQDKAELDLLIVKDGKKIGFEIKYSDKPKTTKSMLIAINDLKLDHLYVIHPHKKTFPLADKITAQSLESLEKL